MEKKILYISTCRECIVEKLSFMLRELGKRTKRPLWGKRFSPDEEVKALLYLDSGGRGNIYMMAKGMSADLTEYIFVDKDTGECHLLLTEMLKSEYKDGEFFYVSSRNSGVAFGNRVKVVNALYENKEVFLMSPSDAEKSPVYSAICGEVKKNTENGFLTEGDMAKLLLSKDVPSVIICDAFSASGAFGYFKSHFGNPVSIHLMNKDEHIYAPFKFLEKEFFIETEDFVKDALFTISRWLCDSGEESCAKRLNKAFASLSGGEELIERTVREFTYTKRKRK